MPASSAPLRTDRRELAILGLGAVTYIFLVYQMTNTSILGNRIGLSKAIRKKSTRYRPRQNKKRQVNVNGLKPGWYLNRKTSAAHQVVAGPTRGSGLIFGAPGLQSTNLKEVNFDSPDADVPGLWAQKRYIVQLRQDLALKALREGKIWQVMNYLVHVPGFFQEPASAVTRRLDLAAGIAIWLNWEQGLEQVTAAARSMAGSGRAGKLKDSLENRIIKWNEPSGSEWRKRRWNRESPLNWAGTSITRDQLKMLIFNQPAEFSEGP